MKPPDKVPDAVIDSIAKRHVCWIRARTPDGREANCHLHDCSDGNWREDNCSCTPDAQRFEDILKGLRWNMDHYSFNWAGMYVGVELDGYMHT